MRYIILIFIILATPLLAQNTSPIMKVLEYPNKSAVTGVDVDLYYYDTDTKAYDLTETSPGVYENSSVVWGQYYLYIDNVNKKTIWHGTRQINETLEQMDPDYNNLLDNQGIEDSVITLSKLTTAALQYMGSGGNIENQADDNSIIANPDSTISVNETWLDTTSTLTNIYPRYINILFTGATPNDATEDHVAIQAAIDSASTYGIGKVLIPAGNYRIGSSIFMKNDVTLFGFNREVSGFTFDSLNYCIRGDGVSNIAVQDLYITHETYPNDTTMMWDGDYFKAAAILFRDVNDVRIERLKITGTTSYGMHIGDNGANANSKNIIINDCWMYNAGYYNHSISVGGNESHGITWDDTDCHSVTITNNRVYRSGQYKWLAPGTLHDTGIAGIKTDMVRKAIVSGNHVRDVQTGIRIEQSVNVVTANNQVENVGAEGIHYYSSCDYGSIANNIINVFGRIPHSAYIRQGTASDTLISRIYFNDDNANDLDLPRTISDGDSGWITWPYAWEHISDAGSLDSIPQWDTTGISLFNPFRGYGGIMVTSNTNNVSITGNHITGNTTQVNGKYTHASDYGIVIDVHPVNQVTLSGGGHSVSGNTVRNVINSTKQIYAPQYQDQVTAINYNRGTAAESSIFPNTATVHDWAAADVLNVGADQPYNDLRVFASDFSNIDASLEQLKAYIGLDPYIFADEFGRINNDSLTVPKFSDIDSIWIPELGNMGIKNKKATTDDGSTARASIALSDSDYVAEFDFENGWVTGRTAWFYFHYEDNNNWLGFSMQSDSTVRFMYNDAGGGATVISTGSNPSAIVTNNDHFIVTANDTVYSVIIQNTNGSHTALQDSAGYHSDVARWAIQSQDSIQTFDNLIIRRIEE